MTSFRENSSNKTPGFRRGPRVADLMTAEHFRFANSSYAAERAGDAETSLAYHRGVPMFARGAHAVQLTQLAALSEEMTPWLWARWAAYQCTRAEDNDESGRIQRAALDYTMRMFYADRVERAYQNGDDPTAAIAQVMGEGWAFHQICTFELGGLQEFMSNLAAGRLAEEAGLARSWRGARMGGYRLVSAGPGSLAVHDLRSNRQVPLLDLGAAVHADADGWLVGRLVPSGVTPALMFDSRPIAVDERTARAVAASSTVHGGWITALKAAITEGRLDRCRLEMEDRELVTDVPSLSLIEAGTPPQAVAVALAQLRRGRDEIGRAAFRILKQVAEGEFGPDRRAAYVAAAVLNPHAFAEASTQLVGTGSPRNWMHWAELVPEPARGRLQRLATAASAVA